MAFDVQAEINIYVAVFALEAWEAFVTGCFCALGILTANFAVILVYDALVQVYFAPRASITCFAKARVDFSFLDALLIVETKWLGRILGERASQIFAE